MISLSLTLLVALLSVEQNAPVQAFTPSLPWRNSAATWGSAFVAPKRLPSPTGSSTSGNRFVLFAETEEEDDDEEKYELEFIDYDDPDYKVDQGVTDEFYDGANVSAEKEDTTEQEIEAMREDRRRRNDEFQFQTYFASILKQGGEYRGEWTIYKTTTFLPELAEQVEGVDDMAAAPRLVKAAVPVRVTSSAYKTKVPSDSQYAVDAERIRHEETFEASQEDVAPEARQVEQEIRQNTYWPEQLAARDFRGEHGIMCVGSAYTLSNGVSLSGLPLDESRQGPFSEYRSEVGLQVDELRMRIKLDYAIIDEDDAESSPPLHLKSLTVCRETLDGWPVKDASDALFGVPGAPGGLYDPPPVGTEAQAGQYMLMDIDGRATILFPYKMDQHPEAHGGQGWVTSMDWTPGNMRYQVDRKVKGGADLLCLRTLELSEVQSMDADEYRPRDGGQNMRQ